MGKYYKGVWENKEFKKYVFREFPKMIYDGDGTTVLGIAQDAGHAEDIIKARQQTSPRRPARAPVGQDLSGILARLDELSAKHAAAEAEIVALKAARKAEAVPLLPKEEDEEEEKTEVDTALAANSLKAPPPPPLKPPALVKK